MDFIRNGFREMTDYGTTIRTLANQTIDDMNEEENYE